MASKTQKYRCPLNRFKGTPRAVRQTGLTLTVKPGLVENLMFGGGAKQDLFLATPNLDPVRLSFRKTLIS
jgi:hypothetical protein